MNCVKEFGKSVDSGKSLDLWKSVQGICQLLLLFRNVLPKDINSFIVSIRD